MSYLTETCIMRDVKAYAQEYLLPNKTTTTASNVCGARMTDLATVGLNGVVWRPMRTP